jgi:aspartate/methionine/tyrosine aminotransferase
VYYLTKDDREGDRIMEKARISNRVSQIPKSAIHEMTRLSKEVDDVAFLSWAKPTSGTPEHINEGAITAIRNGGRQLSRN